MATAVTWTTGIGASRDLINLDHRNPIQSFNFRPSTSLSIQTPGASRHSFTLKINNGRRRNSPVSLAFSGDGGIGNGNNSGGSRCGDGDEEDALSVLAKMGRSVDSIPADLAAAVRSGSIPGSVVKRYLELETSPFSRWFFRFEGFKERLLADDLFLAKVGMECGVGMFTKTAAEYEKRKENFFKELEIVFADVVAAVISNFMLVYLPARPPTRSGNAAGHIARFFYNCPDNALQTAVGGTSSSLSQRLRVTSLNTAKVVAVGITYSLVVAANRFMLVYPPARLPRSVNAGHMERFIDHCPDDAYQTAAVVGTSYSLSKRFDATAAGKVTLINAKKAVHKSSDDEPENIPVLPSRAGRSFYMDVSGNFRCRLRAEVVEQQLVVPSSHQRKLMVSADCDVQVLLRTNRISGFPER